MALTDRQSEIADAGLSIVGRQGMAAVSFRAVAAEAGWSLGAVQKAFSSKDDLVAAMFERLRARAVPMPDGEPGRPTLAIWLANLFVNMMPIDPTSREAYAQASAFTDRAAFDDDIAAAIVASDDEILGRLTMLVRRAQYEGEVAKTVDAANAMRNYLDAAQGAASRMLYAPEAAADVRSRAEQLVSALLG